MRPPEAKAGVHFKDGSAATCGNEDMYRFALAKAAGMSAERTGGFVRYPRSERAARARTYAGAVCNFFHGALSLPPLSR